MQENKKYGTPHMSQCGEWMTCVILHIHLVLNNIKNWHYLPHIDGKQLYFLLPSKRRIPP